MIESDLEDNDKYRSGLHFFYSDQNFHISMNGNFHIFVQKSLKDKHIEALHTRHDMCRRLNKNYHKYELEFHIFLQSIVEDIHTLEADD